MKKQIQFKKIPFKTKLRYLLIGKYPLERKYKPKILEYLFMIFSNIVAFVMTILLLFIIKKAIDEAKPGEIYGNVTSSLNAYESRIFISVLLLTYLVNFILSIHVLYILKKTEFNKLFALLGVLSSLTFLSPIAIVFLIIAYQKNELAFE